MKFELYMGISDSFSHPGDTDGVKEQHPGSAALGNHVVSADERQMKGSPRNGRGRGEKPIKKTDDQITSPYIHSMRAKAARPDVLKQEIIATSPAIRRAVAIPILSVTLKPHRPTSEKRPTVLIGP